MPNLPKGYTQNRFWTSDDKLIQLFHGDCTQVLSSLPSYSVDTVFADPPYNIGYKYDGYNDELPVLVYLDWVRKWLWECSRILKPAGSLWLMCHSTYFHHFETLVAGAGLYTINRVIWRYTFGQNQKDRFTPSWVPIFYAVKPPIGFRKFNADAIRVASARQTKYNDKRANPSGKVPDDVWDDIPRLVGNANERTGHPCQLPLPIVMRAILATTEEGDTVLDPFVGSGTTPAACKGLGRKCIGIESSEAYLRDFVIPRLMEPLTVSG